MDRLDDLFKNNRKWADAQAERDPQFFKRLLGQQAPKYLWIGCSDSRVPANEIVGLLPGEMFVHRNVANVVVHTDFNCLSVIQYAIEALQVEHIIVCGHYGCGGVRAAFENRGLGLIDNWLRNIKDVYQLHAAEIRLITDDEVRLDRLCELNVRHQVANVCHTTIVQDAWRAGRSLAVHGWIYGLGDGLLKELGVTITGPDALSDVYRMEE